MTAGLLRESVLQRYAQSCNQVRERLLIHFLNQSVITQDLDSGGRGRNSQNRRGEAETADALLRMQPNI